MTADFPHVGVLVRLGRSAIHGIGVFAGEPIRVGTTVFINDRQPLRWTAVAALEALDLTPFQRAFYEDFAVYRDGMVGTPESFDLLSVGWYVNEPKPGTAPNLVALEDFSFVSTRDIAPGEELTITYAGFSEQKSAKL